MSFQTILTVCQHFKFMQAICLHIKLAEEEGLEPSDAGIKTQCLNQLGDSPIFISAYLNIMFNYNIQIKGADLTLLQQNL